MARLPNQRYLNEGRNGFTEHPGEPDDPLQPSIPQLEATRRALYILAHKRRPIPRQVSILFSYHDNIATFAGMGLDIISLSQMKEEADKPVDVESLSQRIIDVRDQYLEDLSRLYQLHGQEYQEEATDSFLSRDENYLLALDSYEAMQNLYEASRDKFVLQTTFDDERSRLDYTYLQTVIPLRAQLARLTERDRTLQRQRDQIFPGSIEDYQSMDSNIQLRIATFLCSDEQVRESMRSQYGWAWRQTKPLQDLYLRDVIFREEILSKKNNWSDD